MRTRFLILIFSFLLSIGICLFSKTCVNRTMSNIKKDAEQMESFLRDGQFDKALHSAENLQKGIKQKEKLLEGLVPHEDLHDLSIQIADCALSIEIDDIDDCKKALSLIKENAEHLIKHEAFLLGNIF